MIDLLLKSLLRGQKIIALRTAIATSSRLPASSCLLPAPLAYSRFLDFIRGEVAQDET